MKFEFEIVVVASGYTPEQRMAVALWTLHTHVFDHFTITPRLVLLIPVRGCGHTLVILLEMLVANPDRSDNTTAAAIYHLLARESRSLAGLLRCLPTRATISEGGNNSEALLR